MNEFVVNEWKTKWIIKNGCMNDWMKVVMNAWIYGQKQPFHHIVSIYSVQSMYTVQCTLTVLMNVNIYVE